MQGPGSEGRIWYSHYNKHSTGRYTYNATAKDRLGDDGEGFVDNHVGEQERDQEKVTVLADRENLLGVFTLFPIRSCH